MRTYRTYQGSKNIAKKMLRDRGIFEPIKKGALDTVRMSAYNDAVEYATNYIRNYGQAQATEVDIGDIVFALFGHERWAAVSLCEYRALAS